MPMHRGPGRESGFATIYTMILVTFLMALASAATILCNVGLRAGGDSRRAMKAFYLADTGAQIAGAALRAANGSLGETQFSEPIGYGDATVTIMPLGGGLYQVESGGTTGGQQVTVVMHMLFTPAFDMDGAMQLNFDPGVQVDTDTLHVEISSATQISGQDHDADGNLLADQSEATWGVAMSPVPGNVDANVVVDVLNGASLVGGSTNEAEGQAEVFNQLVEYAKSNADVSVVGGITIRNGDIGDYGTEANPVLVYVDLADEETFEMRQNIIGYGTLVIDTGDVTLDAVLKMQDSTEWHGLVVINFRGEADVAGRTLVRLWDHAKIYGGIALNFNGDGVTITGDGKLMELETGDAAIRYSSAAVTNAVGISEVTDWSARIVSYQVQ